MKICLINNLYKPFNRGGAERMVELAGEQFEKEGNEVIIISSRPYFRSPDAISASRISGNKRVYFIPGLYYNLAKIPLALRLVWHIIDMFDFVNYFRLKKILKNENPDLIITNNLKGLGLLIPRLIKNLGISHTHYLHDIQLIYPSGILFYREEKRLEGFLARAYQKICAWLFNSPVRVVSPSKWLLEEHTKRGFFRASKLEVREFAPPATVSNPRGNNSKRYQEKEMFRFLFVGQVEVHKGIEILMEAFLKLKEKSELVIVGDGSMRKKIEENIRSGQNIIVAGRKNPEEIREMMGQSDCLVVPSLCYENSPAVIYEAVSAGLPVIASRIGGIPELIEKYDGTLFTPGDKDELAAKMDEARRKMV